MPINIDERESILKMLSEQKGMTHIAELLGRNKGTISFNLFIWQMYDVNWCYRNFLVHRIPHNSTQMVPILSD